MPILDIKDTNCTQCSLSAYCDKRCQINPLNTHSDLLIIGPYPDSINEGMDSVMLGGSYDFMRNLMTKVFEADLDRVHFSYMVKCNPRGSEITSESIKACNKYLIEEIEYIKPKAIIILGTYTANSLGFEGELTTLINNNPNTMTIGGVSIPVFITYSPRFVESNKLYVKKFARHLYDAYNTALDKKSIKVDTNVTLITTHEAFDQLLEDCIEVGICSWDFEANGLLNRRYDPTKFFATGLAISFQQGAGYFIPLEQHDSPIEKHLRKGWSMEVLTKFKSKIIQNKNMLIVGQNLKFDFHVLANYVGAFKILADYDDTMYLDHCIDNVRSHKLKEMVTRYYPQYGGYEDEIKKYKWDSIPLSLLATYACVDSDMTLRLKTILEIELLHDTRAYKVYKNIIIPAAKTTFYAEHTGLYVDQNYLDTAIINVTEMMESVQDKIMALPKVFKFKRYCREQTNKKSIEQITDRLDKWLSKHRSGTKTEAKYRQQLSNIKSGVSSTYKGFSITSPKQIRQFLYSIEGLNLKMIKDPKTKKLGTTGESTLKLLKEDSGFIPLLLEFRSLEKTLSTYLKGIRDRLDNEGILHADFLVTGTDTGRLACKDPNLMNMSNAYKQKYPSTKKAVSYIKGMFTPPVGHHIIQVDYSQAELRVIAYYAQCKYMLDAYAKGIDLHAQTAADVLGVTLDEFYKLDKKIQKLQRYRAKAVNFGFIYGMSAESFQHYAFDDYGIKFTLQECIDIRNKFFAKRPELLDYHTTYKGKAHVHGHIRTLFGSKRVLPNIREEHAFKKSNAERQAINTPIQGTSGLMTIFAINILENRLDPRVKFINTVHDSILYYIPDDILMEQLHIIKQTCENLPIGTYFDRHFSEEGKQPVNMAVDLEISKHNWGSLEEISL